MEKTKFTNDVIISWLDYFSKNVDIDLAKLKMIDITGKNKNLIPTIKSNRAVLVFTDAGHPEIFYNMWNAELGECDIWYNEGSEPTGEIKNDKISAMIDRGINAPAAMLILNPHAETNYQIGIENEHFSYGSVNYVCREIRAIIINKLKLRDNDNVCIISGESIAVESAMIANEGSVIAVEYDERDKETMEENIEKFGLKNVKVVDSLADYEEDKLPIPDIGFIVASEKLESELQALLKLNPKIKIVIYSLDFEVLTSFSDMLKRNDMIRTEAIHTEVLRVNSKNMTKAFPAPWIFTCEKE